MADRLKMLGNSVLLFERKPRLGGRIKSVAIGKEIVYDSGALRISREHKKTLKMLVDLNLTGNLKPFNLTTSYHLGSARKSAQLDNPNASAIRTVLSKTRQLPVAVKRVNTFESVGTLHCGYDTTQRAIIESGYDADMTTLNFVDYLEDVDIYKKPFYRLRDGLTQIISRLAKRIGSDCIKVNAELKSIRHSHSKFEIRVNNMRYTCSKLVLAIPQESLLRIPFLHEHTTLFKSVSANNYMRVYAVYPVHQGKTWFHDIERVVTALPIRQVIPIDKNRGLIQIAYCDSRFATLLNNANINGKLYTIIENSLRQIFPHKQIPPPSYIKAHYWSAGTHWWLPHVNSKTASRQIIQPDSTKALFVVGEAYSLHQGWIEGALQTCDAVISKLEKKRNQLTTYITAKDVKKHNTRKDAWVIYNKNVYDITAWIPSHPGGPVIERGLGKDMTALFNSVGHSRESINVLGKYYIGKLPT